MEAIELLIVMMVTFLLGMICMGFVQDALKLSEDPSPEVLKPVCAPANQSVTILTEYVNVTKYLTIYEEQNFTLAHDPHCGWYFGGEVSLYPHRIQNYSEYMDCARHEYAHYVWFTDLKQSERNEWKREFRNAKVFPSDYARTSVEEFYAESWRE